MFRRVAILVAMACGCIGVVMPAQAGAVTTSGTTTTNCVVTVIGQEPSGEFELSAPQCYGSFRDAMSAVGLGSGITNAAQASVAIAASMFTLGIHYDGANFTGSSFSVVGADCNGGYINMSLAWNDRVSSTIGGCPRVRHFYDINLGGIFQDTTASGNLTTLNNQVSSIQYLNS